MSGPALVAGVDSSTQSTKVELRELDSGRLVATGRGAHPATSPPVSEQDPAAWWAALTDALGQVGGQLDRVVGISVAGQQHGSVVLDDKGATIRPAKLWNDTTSAPQAAALRDRIGADTWARRCGLVPVASFTITKLGWLAEHEPEHMARVASIMLPHDWLTWRLTGRHVTDRGDASGTGWWSPVDGDYRDDLLGLVVDDPAGWREKLPQVLGPAEAAGTVRADVATELGVRPDVVVGPGTGDNMAAALGLALKPREVTLSLGTSGTAYAVATAPTTDATGAVAGFADAAGGFLPLVATLNATKVTETVARWLGVDVATLSEMALADRTPGPVLVPYFDGERTPNLPDATGTWLGLRNDTTREDLARAAFTGVVNGLLGGVDALEAAGVEMDGSLRLIGGGARSPAYRQITADLWGSAITVHADAEPVATGACVQAAAVMVGRAPLDVATSWQLDAGTPVEPDPQVDGTQLRAAYRDAVRGPDPSRSGSERGSGPDRSA
jgi:xylulokinase